MEDMTLEHSEISKLEKQNSKYSTSIGRKYRKQVINFHQKLLNEMSEMF